MTKLLWDQVGSRFYETGVDRGVLYPRLGPGVAWNGLVSVNETISGGEVDQLYYDGVKYLDVVANEDYQATIEAFSAPAEFAACDGSKTLSPGLYATHQPRKTFGLSYRTLLGNDLESTEYGYKLHIVYGCTASPSAKNSQTLSNTPSPSTRQWTVNTVPPTPETYASYKPTAHFVISSRGVNAARLATLESYLYGTAGTDPRLLTQEEVIDVLNGVAI